MLLILGLDGATWALLDPWIQQGRLPNLGRLRRDGLWGPLASTMPAATFPSWTTFMTGVNPGKHGIFDFTRRQLGSYAVRFVNASFRKVPTVWRMLSDAGRRVCVLGLPGTYPPEEVNGCMISGFDTPVTTRADRSFISPSSLAPLVMELGGFPFADFQEFRVSRRWYRVAIERLLRGIETKTRLAKELLTREAWDCFLLLFGESDTVAHHFWKFHDVGSPQFDPEAALEFGDAVRRVYEALDVAIGTLTSAAPNASVLVVSDHGFGGAGHKAVHLNRWLAEQGLLRMKRKPSRSPLSHALKRAALGALPAAVQARMFRLQQGRWAGWLESRARFAGIEWAQTRAFSEELNYFPSVWLNVKGREPEGVVAPGDYDRVCEDICAAVHGLTDPEHGGPVVRRAWRRHDLYHGPWVDFAPDVVLEFHLDRGYSYNCLSSTGAPGGRSVRVLDASEGGGKLSGMSGSHRPQGVFLLSGDTAWAERPLAGLHMADMTPTILRLCGVQASADFDGVAIDALGAECLGGGRLAGWACASEQPYTPAEEREVAARLGALGYLQ